MLKTHLDVAVSKGIDFLARRQLPSGQFPVEVTFHYMDGSPVQQDEALFATTHIVYSLGFLPHPAAQTMTSRASSYFQNEMSGQGLWRYWNKTAKWGERRLYPFIPADLDDMANVSFLLRRQGITFPDNRAFMHLNRDRRGLFYTWLVPRPIATINLKYWYTVLRDMTFLRMIAFWKTTEAGYADVDGVVNANVLLYLGECAETQNAIAWLVEIVSEGLEATCDKWYRDAFTFYYALSRNYHEGITALGAAQAQMLSRLEAASHADGKVGDHVLHTALGVNTMLNFGVRTPQLDAAIEYIASTQADDGSWESRPLYYGGPQQSVSWGSPELTTGICLEALQRALDESI